MKIVLLITVLVASVASVSADIMDQLCPLPGMSSDRQYFCGETCCTFGQKYMLGIIGLVGLAASIAGCVACCYCCCCKDRGQGGVVLVNTQPAMASPLQSPPNPLHLHLPGQSYNPPPPAYPNHPHQKLVEGVA